MNPFQSVIDRVSGLSFDRVPGLRPPCPPVSLEFDGRDLVLVRMKQKRRGKPVLETHKVTQVLEDTDDTSSFHSNLRAAPELPGKVKELFQVTGTKPGKVSLVLPDNLAKITLLSLPEKVGSRKQLDEIVRFKLRRAIPFRLEEAVVSYHPLPGDNGGMNVLVALMRRALVELYEKAVEGAGARPGLVDLCTTNILNLARNDLQKTCAAGGDAALLNLARSYFSLIIVRQDRLIFYRCKSLPTGSGDAEGNGVLNREISNSIAYYEEKLQGKGIGTMLVRSAARPVEEVREMVEKVGIPDCRPVETAVALDLPEGLVLDSEVAQRIAPGVGAAAGRSR